MKCPICKREFDPSNKDQTRYFPFCSDRCRLIDLGRWLGGKYQIPVEREELNDLDFPPPSDERE